MIASSFNLGSLSLNFLCGFLVYLNKFKLLDCIFFCFIYLINFFKYEAREKFQEFTAANQTLNKFKEDFFSQDLLVFDRSLALQTKNDDLNFKIKNLLMCLAPHFLDSDSHVIYDWLFLKFKLHQFNAASLVMSLLPFNQTNAFTKMLQIISDHIAENSFLIVFKKIANSGIQISNHIITSQFLANPELFASFCDHYKVLIDVIQIFFILNSQICYYISALIHVHKNDSYCPNTAKILS